MLPRTRNAPSVLDVNGKRKLKKGSNEAVHMILTDPGEAKAVDQKYGRKGSGDVIVAERPRTHKKPGSHHNYHWDTYNPEAKTCATEGCWRKVGLFNDTLCPKHAG